MTSNALRRVTLSSPGADATSTQNPTTSGMCPASALGCDSMSSSSNSYARPALVSSPAAMALRAVEMT